MKVHHPHNLPARSCRQALLLGACALLLFASGCGKNSAAYRWDQQVFAAGRVQDKGELDRAERAYFKLMDSAPSQDARRFVWMELADISRARENWPQAIERYQQVYSEPKDDEAGALALYRTGIITEEHLGDPARGRALRRETITRFPASVAAEMAVRDHARYYVSIGDLDAMIDDLMQLFAQTRDEPVADNLLFAIAETLRENGREVDALPYYKRVWTEYPGQSLEDTSLWEAAQIYERYQAWDQAIPLYDKLANMLVKSWFMGSYNSQWANDARIRLGMIDLLHRDNLPGAKAHFEQYLRDFPDGLLSDDVAWDLVQVKRLLGGPDAYKAAMRDFARDWPESRYVREVNRRLGLEGER